ncbi:hypothetical protein HOY82DRAFT_292548 [Tuber indicum]|nr:hypothetical protein HOY82DRAFT_292548 [Tuber indicum]
MGLRIVLMPFVEKKKLVYLNSVFLLNFLIAILRGSLFCMNNFSHGVFFFFFFLLLMCYSSGIPSNLRNGVTFRAATRLWKDKEGWLRGERIRYHRRGKTKEGGGMACMQAVAIAWTGVV